VANASGDGFDDFFRETYDGAFRAAYRILHNVQAAEDVASEALARALVAWRRVGPLPYRRSWVLRVTINRAIDVARHEHRRPDNHARAVDLILDSCDAVPIRVDLIQAVNALPRRQREAIALRHVAGLSEEQVAQCMSISRNSVKKHTQRGLDTLRTRLNSPVMEVNDV
jgi:RNA polymerase sigma factor (sigma-70 family)